jgi:hypothetical protein
MHGGVFYRRETHGSKTLRAIAERKKERALLREMKRFNEELEANDREK